ncbi:MAG TPA: hypothetical protein VI488_21485, partial [Candidatus Angelobacter sp.]
AYTRGYNSTTLLDYQNRVHELVRSIEALSLCTVHSTALERRVLLAVLADHRRAARGRLPINGEVPPRATGTNGYPQ